MKCEMPRFDVEDGVLMFVAPELEGTTRCAIGREYCSPKKLSVKVLKDAMVSPGEGLFDGSGKYVQGTSVHDGWPWEGRTAPTCKNLKDEDVVYLGTFNPCWGHCLTDCLQRLWFFYSHEVPSHIKALHFVYSVSPRMAALPNNFLELLKLLGYDVAQLIRIYEPTRFKNIHLPESCFYYDREADMRRYTSEYKSLIDLIVDKACPNVSTSGKSVYFSRTAWKTNKEIGEKLIENEFSRIGYEIVHPECMSLIEIINTLRSCKRFASTDGSIAHNIVFMKNNAEAVIVRKASYVNAYQDCLNRVSGVKVVYVDANMSNMLYDKDRPWMGPFFLYVNKRLAALTSGRSCFPALLYLKYCTISLFVKLRKKCSKTLIGRLMRLLRKASQSTNMTKRD